MSWDISPQIWMREKVWLVWILSVNTPNEPQKHWFLWLFWRREHSFVAHFVSYVVKRVTASYPIRHLGTDTLTKLWTSGESRCQMCFYSFVWAHSQTVSSCCGWCRVIYLCAWILKEGSSELAGFLRVDAADPNKHRSWLRTDEDSQEQSHRDDAPVSEAFRTSAVCVYSLHEL